MGKEGSHFASLLFLLGYFGINRRFLPLAIGFYCFESKNDDFYSKSPAQMVGYYICTSRRFLARRRFLRRRSSAGDFFGNLLRKWLGIIFVQVAVSSLVVGFYAVACQPAISSGISCANGLKIIFAQVVVSSLGCHRFQSGICNHRGRYCFYAYKISQISRLIAIRRKKTTVFER